MAEEWRGEALSDRGLISVRLRINTVVGEGGLILLPLCRVEKNSLRVQYGHGNGLQCNYSEYVCKAT